MKIYIWGTGKLSLKIKDTLIDLDSFCGYIDNDPEKQGKEWHDYHVFSFEDVVCEADYIILSMVNTESVIVQVKKINKDSVDKLIGFYEMAYYEKGSFFDVINKDKWHIELLEHRVCLLEKRLLGLSNNVGYEVSDGISRGLYKLPHFGDTRDAIDMMANKGYSFVRYGDGEFELLLGNERPPFQNVREELSTRLRETLNARESRLLIGIAADYGNIDHYQQLSVDGIREYLTPEVRASHMSVLDNRYTYYDAGMFRCYFPFKDREKAIDRINLTKSIWKNRNIILVEGNQTRAGVGNDLFSNANSVRRILCPTKNAFDKYDEIFTTVLKKVTRDSDLILIILGPTSVPLVYDLYKKGYQAIDLGQVDMDYEWFLAGSKNRVPIYGKYVSQLPDTYIPESENKEYLSQIVARIV